jgi:glycosyltransferase involved in cell wall biosynthesis
VKVWLLTVGEPLPIDPERQRLHRSGILAETLAGRGIDVVWWAGAWQHASKTMLFAETTATAVNDRLKLWCLGSRPYRRNVSVARIRANREVAAAFRAAAATEPPPDVILASYPIPDLAEAGGLYARERAIPAVIDIRDLWPDIWPSVLPRPLQPAGRLALAPFFRQSQRAMRLFPAICGITDPIVDWGLERAGRARGPWDRAFPLAYPQPSYPAAEIEDARRLWAQRLAGLPPARLTLVYFGMLSPRARVDVVVDAVRRLPDAARAAVRVILCGAGEDLPALRARAADLPQIVFPGWVTGPQIQALAEIGHAGLLPYPSAPDFERSIPNKVIEYLALGLPVLASLRGPVRALIEDEQCGKAYAETDPKALAGILLDLLEYPQQLATLSARARQLFARSFGAEKIYGAFADLLAELAEGRPRRAIA